MKPTLPNLDPEDFQPPDLRENTFLLLSPQLVLFCYSGPSKPKHCPMTTSKYKARQINEMIALDNRKQKKMILERRRRRPEPVCHSGFLPEDTLGSTVEEGET